MGVGVLVLGADDSIRVFLSTSSSSTCTSKRRTRTRIMIAIAIATRSAGHHDRIDGGSQALQSIDAAT